MSKRITKAMAEHAAEELAKNVYDEKIENAEKAFRQLSIEMYVKYVPSPVRQCAEEFKKFYAMYRKYISVVPENDEERRYRTLDLGFSIPDLNTIVVSIEDWKVIEKASVKLRELEKTKDQFYFDVSSALFNLRTENRVKEMFPEALPYLNFADTTALACDLSKLRSVLR